MTPSEMAGTISILSDYSMIWKATQVSLKILLQDN